MWARMLLAMGGLYMIYKYPYRLEHAHRGLHIQKLPKKLQKHVYFTIGRQIGMLFTSSAKYADGLYIDEYSQRIYTVYGN